MQESTTALSELLNDLTRAARRLGLNDTEWAMRAGVRKETLSRLRRRTTCDLETLHALANAVNAQLKALETQPPTLTADGHFPSQLDRDQEERLLELCASRPLIAQRWLDMGPGFFMAGLAVMVASAMADDRRSLLELAETLHPGVTEPAVFTRWLERSPVRPSRFLPLLDMEAKHAA